MAVCLEHRIVSTILMYDFFTGVEGHLRRPFRCDFWTDEGGISLRHFVVFEFCLFFFFGKNYMAIQTVTSISSQFI